jgi:DNA replicative helicase MCM subunit Mcm2 (Cdc46/Mcm family)
MSNDRLTDDVNKRFDDTDTENNNDGDSSLDINLDKQSIASSLHNENGAAKRNKRDQTRGSTSDQDVPGVDFPISDKQKELGIICIARENNTIVVEVRNEESDENPLVIRRAINFKDWNIFIRDLRKNIFDNLRYEIPDPKHLNRIIANVETVLNRNFESIGTINKSKIQTDDDTHEGTEDTAAAIPESSSNDESQQNFPLITINELVKKQSGTFNTGGAVVSITPIMQAISSIKWKCSNENVVDYNRNPVCDKPNNERLFDPPVLRIDGLTLRCTSCSAIVRDIAESNVLKEWQNYVIIQMQDSDSPSIDDLQKMTVLVYDEYVNRVHIGETIHIHGNVRVPLKSYDKPYSGRTLNSNLSSVLYAQSITEERREQIEITDRDKKAFTRFVKYPDLPKRLASMFAPNVIGHEDKKLAVLLAAAGAPEISNKKKRGRIHILFVGPPGTAKTTLSYEAVNLLPNSRFTAAQTSTSKTILAIIEVQGDTKIIKYGAIPLARNAICIIDEIGAMSYDDQVSLFNVMEHGEFPLNKYGESKMVPAQTTIIGTSNPKNINASWTNSAKASKDEIPLRRALIDRFDIVMIFTDEDTEESAHEYASKKMQLNKRHAHNYRFLQKLLHFIRSSSTEIIFTKEAEVMVTNYFASLKVNKNLAMTNRALDILIRLCQAWARLHLKTVVNSEIVCQVQSFFSLTMLQYGEVVKAVVDPREIACDIMVGIIKQTEGPISFEEAARTACHRDQVVRDYIGPNMKLRDNNILHDISEKVRQYSNIKSIGLRPLVLEWIKTKEQNEVVNKQAGHDRNTGTTTTREGVQ